jgi:8-oxo-dGTP diphosphatase
LLLKRSAASKHFAGQWEWPGGKTDAGEDFTVALHREVSEETGLTVELTGYAGATAFPLPQIHIVVLCLEAVATGGTVTLSAEHEAAEWVALSELASWDLADTARPFMLDYAAKHRTL